MTGVALRRRGDRAVFGAVFLMLFVFSYSEQIVSAVFPVISGQQGTAWRIAVVVVDAVVLAAAGLMKRTIATADGDGPRLWGWWWTGVAVLLAVDVVRLWPLYSITVDTLIATLYALAMGWTMAATLNADPLALVSSERRIAAPRDWLRVRAIVPLVVGAWLCYLAASAFVDHFDLASVRTLSDTTAAEIADLPLAERMSVLAQLCHGAISPVFFQQIVEVLPVLLLTLGVEFNYFRRIFTDAGQRAATAATVTVLAVGLVGGLSTLPWDGQGCGDVLSGWHEYFAFLFAVQAVFTGLVTLVWLLISSTPDAPTAVDDG